MRAGCVKQPLKAASSDPLAGLQRTGRAPALPWHHPGDASWGLLLLPPPRVPARESV